MDFFNQLAEGFILDKTSSPLGVLLIIFESRPDALVQVKRMGKSRMPYDLNILFMCFSSLLVFIEDCSNT